MLKGCFKQPSVRWLLVGGVDLETPELYVNRGVLFTKLQSAKFSCIGTVCLHFGPDTFSQVDCNVRISQDERLSPAY